MVSTVGSYALSLVFGVVTLFSAPLKNSIRQSEPKRELNVVYPEEIIGEQVLLKSKRVD